MRSEEQERQSKDFKCELFDYICKKTSTLKKHINTKHTEQKCEICKMKFKTAMEIVSHIVKEHHKQEEETKVDFRSTPKLGKGNMDSSFPFDDSILNEFL